MARSSSTRGSWLYTNVMVPMDLGSDAECRAKLAADLADRFSSGLLGIAAADIRTPLYFESDVTGVVGIIEMEERRARENLKKAEASFRRIAGGRNKTAWRQSLMSPIDYVLEQARAADLIVAERVQRAEDWSSLMGVNGGSLVLGAGRPVLFVPPKVDYVAAKRVIIGWKDTREARRAVWDSLPFLKLAKEVLVVAITAERGGAQDASDYLARHGIASGVLERAESDAAVADELIRLASQEGADLIVCGAYGHSRAREWILGGVTRDLLDHSPLCCLMTH